MRLLSFVFAFAILASCDSDGQPSNTDSQVANNEQAGAQPTDSAPSTDEVVSSYLKVKNALVADNSDDAASAGKELASAIQNLEGSSFTPEQKSVYDEVKGQILEHAQHINTKAGDIAHQREHFDMLSQDVYDLVKTAKPTQTLYKDYCPMYDKKGAIWLSEHKDIKNPYYGSEMLTCGERQEEIK